MNSLKTRLWILVAVLPLSANAMADGNLWLGAKAGTLGIGVEGTWRPLPWFDIRAGANRYDYSDTGSQAGINYAADLRLDSYYATLNFRFPLSPMRLTAGGYANGNELVMVSQDSPSFNIGGNAYTSSDVGTLRATTSFDGTSPYLGVGFDFDLFNRVGLTLDFGVLWQGEPGVALAADGLLASDPAFVDALEAERLELESEMEAYKAWPVLSLGFNFSFL